MYRSLKRNEMLSLRLVLAAPIGSWFLVAWLLGCFVLVCFAQPAAPQVSIEIMVIDGVDHVKLSWEPVAGAESYNIYASPVVNPEDWGDPLATVGDSVFTYITEDSVDELGSAYFFYVTAYAEELMVLVDGDRFNGNVHIDPFYMSKYQVTQEEWVEVMGEWDFHFGGNPTHPAEMVSWFDAVEYCNRLSIREGLTPAYSYLESGTNPDDWYEQHPRWNTVHANHTNVLCDWEADGYRLPTEVEWHHAANGARYMPESGWPFGSPFQYSGSNDVDEVAWYSDNSGNRTHPVGTKAPNGLSIYDMSGNVFEFCWDIRGGTFPSGGDNPRGADFGAYRVWRGGSWNFAAAVCTVSGRSSFYATSRSGFNGFRVARNAPPRDRMVLVDGDLFNGEVTIDPFYISKYQVTRAEFRDIMGADWGFTHPNPGVQPEPTDDNYPANRLSWFDAVEYCNRLSIREGLTPAYSYLDSGTNPDDWYDQWPGWNEDNDNHTNISCDWEVDGYRLPTEAEWHHAANGAVHDPESEWPFGSPYQYAGSDDIDAVAWYSLNSDIGDGRGRRTHPVGTKAPNGLGIYDMSGNVWEWCWDRWLGTFPSGNDNPRGDGIHATIRVFRGGSWNIPAAGCAVSCRDGTNATIRYYLDGFRVCRIIP